MFGSKKRLAREIAEAQERADKAILQWDLRAGRDNAREKRSKARRRGNKVDAAFWNHVVYRYLEALDAQARERRARLLDEIVKEDAPLLLDLQGNEVSTKTMADPVVEAKIQRTLEGTHEAVEFDWQTHAPQLADAAIKRGDALFDPALGDKLRDAVARWGAIAEQPLPDAAIGEAPVDEEEADEEISEEASPEEGEEDLVAVVRDLKDELMRRERELDRVSVAAAENRVALIQETAAHRSTKERFEVAVAMKDQLAQESARWSELMRELAGSIGHMAGQRHAMSGELALLREEVRVAKAAQLKAERQRTKSAAKAYRKGFESGKRQAEATPSALREALDKARLDIRANGGWVRESDGATLRQLAPEVRRPAFQRWLDNVLNSTPGAFRGDTPAPPEDSDEQKPETD